MPNITTITLREATRNELRGIKEELRDTEGATQTYDDVVQLLIHEYGQTERDSS